MYIRCETERYPDDPTYSKRIIETLLKIYKDVCKKRGVKEITEIKGERTEGETYTLQKMVTADGDNDRPGQFHKWLQESR